MTLSKPEKSILRQLVQSPQYGALERLMKEMIEKYQGEMGSRASEWETTRNTLINEGKIRGLSDLMKEIYLQIQSNE